MVAGQVDQVGREVRLKIEDLAVIEALAGPVTEALMVEDRVDRMAVAAPVGRPIRCGSSSMRWSSTRMGTVC